MDVFLKTDVHLDDGTCARAVVRSGASKAMPRIQVAFFQFLMLQSALSGWSQEPVHPSYIFPLMQQKVKRDCSRH
ncbi:unnamed protein product [Amaranthus hypochondriacus]